MFERKFADRFVMWKEKNLNGLSLRGKLNKIISKLIHKRFVNDKNFGEA